jgi:hypothetical protein
MADRGDTKPEGPGSAPQLISRVRDQQFRDVYANASFTGLSPYDVTLTFAKSGDVMGQMLMVEQVAVTMSPQQFKQFCKAINESLKAYEKVFGTLTIPEADILPGTSAEKIEEMLLSAREKAKLFREATNAPAISASSGSKQPSKRSRGASRQKS